jgi:hypothetical protein
MIVNFTILEIQLWAENNSFAVLPINILIKPSVMMDFPLAMLACRYIAEAAQ